MPEQVWDTAIEDWSLRKETRPAGAGQAQGVPFLFGALSKRPAQQWMRGESITFKGLPTATKHRGPWTERRAGKDETKLRERGIPGARDQRRAQSGG